MSKKQSAELKCICGHDLMLHGYYNMGCSVILSVNNNKENKCPCSKFEESK